MAQTTTALHGFVVLVVEDDPETLAAVTYLITNGLGYDVASASSCGDALAILDSGAHVDLLFSDVMMPGMDGVTLASLVRQQWPALPVVLATGYANAIDFANENGAIPLIKPYSIEQLEAVFTEHVQGRTGSAKHDRAAAHTE